MGVELRSIDVHALAGADEIGQDQSDGQGDGGHRFEIEKRLSANPTDFLQIARPGDAVHHDAKDDRRHDHRDELEESVREEFEADGEIRRRHAERDAEHEPRHHLREQ
jgi:hypothetical protein